MSVDTIKVGLGKDVIIVGLLVAVEGLGNTLTRIVTIVIANSISGFKITPPSEVLLHYNDTR